MESESRVRIKVFQIFFDNLTTSQAVEKVGNWLSENLDGDAGLSRVRRFSIATPNPEFVMRARADDEFLGIINESDLAIPDGIGIIWAGRILGTPFKERVAGIDLMLRLCEMAERQNWKIALLGAGKNVANKTLECLKKRFASLDILVWEVGEVDKEGEAIDGSAIGKVLSSGKTADICFVALGMGKQERFTKRYIDVLPAKVFMGVGGSFDYIAGIVPRAPKVVRDLGFEWSYRLIREPWRFKRQIEVWRFGVLVIWAKMKSLFGK